MYSASLKEKYRYLCNRMGNTHVIVNHVSRTGYSVNVEGDLVAPFLSANTESHLGIQRVRESLQNTKGAT